MLLAKTLSYYKRKDVQEAILEHTKNKEVAVKFEEGFGKRPDVLNYPNDILEFARQRAISFHCSEELWTDPLQLQTEMSKGELDELRLGWDLILDIDCKIFEYSKIAAYYTIMALRHQGINCVSCKFSGNKGFHIGIPWEAFPKFMNKIETKTLFPEAPRKIAEYIKFLIKELTTSAIVKLEKNDFKKISRKTGLEPDQLVYTEKNEDGTKTKLDSEKFLTIDTIFISSRHMYRMPYSLHEKSGLASVPIRIEELLKFDKRHALPENVVINKALVFLDRSNAKDAEAAKLLIQSYDFMVNTKKQENEFGGSTGKHDWLEQKAVPEQFFPPCMKNILNGIRDGRKRSVFILINFLRCMNWPKEDIEKFIYQWNQKNPEKLREGYIKGQLRYQTDQRKKLPPPNCDNTAYYKDFGACIPDELCSRIKNPVQYVKRRLYYNKSFWKKPIKPIKKPKKIQEKKD